MPPFIKESIVFLIACLIGAVTYVLMNDVAGFLTSALVAVLAAVIVEALWVLYVWHSSRRPHTGQARERKICEQAEQANPGTRATILSNGQVFLTDRTTGAEVKHSVAGK